MTRFELLKQTDIVLAARLIFYMGKMFDDPEELREHLATIIPKKELQQINAAAQME